VPQPVAPGARAFEPVVRPEPRRDVSRSLGTDRYRDARIDTANRRALAPAAPVAPAPAAPVRKRTVNGR
jgi:hypothetical protein